MFNRRRFIERLGLGAGATLLAPLARTLVGQAFGETATRKRAVFLLASNGLPPGVFTPPGIPVATTAILPGVRDFALPPMWKPLEPHRDRLLLIEGLANRVSGEHSGGHGALSGVNVTRFTGQDNGPPGAISIDQFIANAIGRTTAMKSLLWGVSRSAATLESRIFAAGRERPIPHYLTVAGLWERLFGPTGAASPEVARRRRPLFDVIRKDLGVLRAQLAPAERAKLDEYSEVLESSEKRLAAAQPVTCARPAAPGAAMSLEARIAAMNELSIMAVVCGLTNVVGISIGCGNGHDAPLFTELHRGTPFEAEGVLDLGTHGHYPTAAAVQEVQFTHVAKVAARMVEAWSAVKEGTRSIFDDTVIVITSDNGEQHHSKKDRWPVALVGNAGGALKADGRFLRYQPGGSRALVDLYSSIANATGAPTDAFGKGGVEQARGPLPELMA
jgi:hypothetical protein